MISIEQSWHTDREWFVRHGATYCGEVMYYPVSMRWHARPWRVTGRMVGRFFADLNDAIQFTVTAVP